MLRQWIAAARAAVKRLPGVTHLLETGSWNRLRHWRVLHWQPRANWTFTQFFRLPTQFDALVGPVLEFLRPGADAPLRVVLVGCSNGAEAVTIAAILKHRVSGLAFRVDAYDIEPSVLAVAERGEYTREQVCNNPFVTDGFIAQVFDVEGDRFVVKPALRAHLRFALADLLDPGFVSRVGPADIVFAQNFMFHLPRRDNPAAFQNLCGILKPRAALFLEGMDHDLRMRLTRRAGLQPLGFGLEQIYAEARVRRGPFWPWRYMGLEPFHPRRRDAARRYATIYLRDDTRPV